ncbi:hypothetical protein LAZ67_19000508 [Cordylochernes scorpioides]|uniref:Endonuclease n=1 Tax=Cordylochernes scorpioides TaxID=51811 RepID=A0ABY6LH74_9ARAC|nr:hypothetical protein LAZ67_19000508 [Cordylochernes scorpioides]
MIESKDDANLQTFKKYILDIKSNIEKTYCNLLTFSEFDDEVYFSRVMQYKDNLRNLVANINKVSCTASSSKIDDLNQPTTSKIELPKFNLPSFSGDVNEWLSFKQLFSLSIDSNTALTDSQKLQYLQSAVTGDAERLIRGFPVIDENYAHAWATLVSRYDNKKELAFSQCTKLFTLKPLKLINSKAIFELLDICNEAMRNLKSLGLERNTLVDIFLIHFLQRKIGDDLKRQWELTLIDDGFPSYENFIMFLEKQAKSLQSIKGYAKEDKSVVKQTHVYNSISKGDDKCLLCKNSHPIFKCDKFHKSSLLERWNIVKTNNLCFNCLRSNHRVTSCKITMHCKSCNKKHHTLLHSFQPEPLNTTSIEAPIAQSGVSCFLSDTTKPNETILLSTAIVRVRAENGSFHPCRALIDTGSQRSLITENCREKLNLPVKKSQLTVFGIGNQPIQQSANPNFDKTSPIDLVIGADLAPFLYTGKLRFQNHPGPTACSSKLGWILSGNVSSSETGNNYISLCSTSQGDDNLRQFFELESVPAALPLTKEEKSCGDIYDKNFCISTDGRYSVGLPFKSVPNLGDSRQNAMKRFLALERKLHKSSNLLQQYKDFMMEYLSLNHMELIPKKERDKPSDKCYYIPHHCVLREQSSTTKLKVVFDASCKTSNNYSLNDFLHTGPKLQHDIFNILVKFRTNPIAFTGDIEKMYRQIKVNSSDLDFQRIFWRNSPLESLLEYRLLTVTYGMSCAPYLAIRTLMQLATDKELLFPEASKILKTDFYVDDLLSGATTIEEAKVLIDDIRKILLSGGFCIRKWMSNVPEVLSEVPEALKAHDSYEIGDNSSVKILGINWNPSTDNFTITVNSLKDVYSKRQLLSDISRIYDPLGWLSPVIISFKILFQTLWKQDLDWDDPLSESLCSHWRRVKMDLAMLNHIKIPRYISCKGLIHSLELHGFCDASESAYSSVVYMKSRFKSGHVQVTLIAAKTKVAPLKATSIPRLELCAALLLSNLYDSICSSLLLQIDRVILWTDSQIVLCWIKSESKHWKPFVGNRIAEIQRLTLQSSWYYVSTKDNPADCASRGITSSELVNHSLWWNGPDWLSNSSLQDPLPITYELPKEVCHEKRKTVPIVHFTTCPIIDFIFKFSTFRKLSRVTAWLLRFIHNARHSSDKIKHKELSSNELDNSIRTLIQIIQSSEFKTEIQCCNQSKVLPSNSKLLSLNPFIDSSGILRVGGRLRKSNLQFNEKHPIILPHNHFVTELIVQQFHVEHLHSGLQLTLCAIRQKYWIPSGRILVKKLINRCMTCFKTKRQVSKQIMGDLPIHRIIPSSPFSKTGIDFAGPFITKPNVIRTKVTLKSYIALFICFSTKAIHLEIVSDLSTPAFLAAFRRFISRRGKPSDIFTDNATNFKGAKNILNNIHQLVKDSSIQSYVANEHITWHFIPPSAPNFGGIWEAGIKSLKYHLLRCLKSAVLNFEELNTLTSQIEACLNSRPLYPMSSDPNDFNPLTPGHFLIGRPLTALPEPSYHPNDNYLTRWKLIQKARDVFWQRWSREYLNNLQQRSKWKKTLFQPESWRFGVGKRLSYAFNAVEPWPHHQVKDGVYKRKPRNLDILWNEIQAVCREISLDVLIRCTESVVTRTQNCIDAAERWNREERRIQRNQWSPIPTPKVAEAPLFRRKKTLSVGRRKFPPARKTSRPPPPVSDVLGSLARTIYQLSSATGLSRDVELPRYDGSYEAQSFFDNYDAQADLAQLHYTDRLRRLPNLLQGKALHYFRSLKLDKLYYVDARQALIDLFPETTNASFAQFLAIKLTDRSSLEEYYQKKTVCGLQLNLPHKILLESLTDGLPVADQRIVAAVQPNTLQAWYSVVSRVRGTHSASQVCQQTTRTTPNPSFAPSPRYSAPRPWSARPNYSANPPPSSCRYCGAMHWHAQCPKRPAQSRPRPVYRATTYPQHDRTVLSSPAPFQVNNTRAHVTRSPDPLYTTSPAQAVNPSCPIGTSNTAPKQACSDAQDSTTLRVTPRISGTRPDVFFRQRDKPGPIRRQYLSSSKVYKKRNLSRCRKLRVYKRKELDIDAGNSGKLQGLQEKELDIDAGNSGSTRGKNLTSMQEAQGLQEKELDIDAGSSGSTRERNLTSMQEAQGLQGKELDIDAGSSGKLRVYKGKELDINAGSSGSTRGKNLTSMQEAQGLQEKELDINAGRSGSTRGKNLTSMQEAQGNSGSTRGKNLTSMQEAQGLQGGGQQLGLIKSGRRAKAPLIPRRARRQIDLLTTPVITGITDRHLEVHRSSQGSLTDTSGAQVITEITDRHLGVHRSSQGSLTDISCCTGHHMRKPVRLLHLQMCQSPVLGTCTRWLGWTFARIGAI